MIIKMKIIGISRSKRVLNFKMNKKTHQNEQKNASKT